MRQEFVVKLCKQFYTPIVRWAECIAVGFFSEVSVIRMFEPTVEMTKTVLVGHKFNIAFFAVCIEFYYLVAGHRG